MLKEGAGGDLCAQAYNVSHVSLLGIDRCYEKVITRPGFGFVANMKVVYPLNGGLHSFFHSSSTKLCPVS